MRREALAAAHPGWLALAIAVFVAAIYAPVRGYPFVVFDDAGLVADNPLVNGGLSLETLRRAFTESALGNWVPLAWLSHALDVELFGFEAGGHHVTSVLLHAAASVLLFEALRRMTAKPGPAAFAALVFAVHPAHVESVAWIAERRDVLCGLFWMLTLLAWTAYARAERFTWLALATLCYAAALLSKPMAVTLPLVLLLLDLWPLGRASRGPVRLLAEKLPLAAVALAVAAATLETQSQAGAVVTLDMLPVSLRLANALTSTVAYLSMTLWPAPLAVFYPYPEAIPAWQSVGAAALLLLLTAAALAMRRRRPWLAVGWAWYLVTLVPVIGLVQVGSQAMADRYTYLPMIGLALAAAWQAQEWVQQGGRGRTLVLAVIGAWLLACVLLARAQVSTWQDSATLFEHARRVSGNHPIILVNLGEAYEEAGDSDRAIEHYEAALAGYAHAPRARTRLGALYMRRGMLPQAARHLEEALRRHPEEARTRLEIGRLLLRDGQLEPAAEHLREEHERFGPSAEALFHLAEARAALGEHEEATALFAEAFALDPGLPDEPLLSSPEGVEALAAGLAAAGRHAQAVHWTRLGLRRAQLAGQAERAARLTAALPGREAAAAASRPRRE
ncbi:MAG: tetratricopeptide repeat protein [Myxococcales bacterium]|nr:tetratricopeptide repeat protein [Myxococcales bacterium]